MSEESDSLSAGRVSATEVSRAFSEFLDQIERGKTFIVQRYGRDVCMMIAAPQHGRRASECLALLRGRSSVLLDEAFTDDLIDVVASPSEEERPAWDS